MMSLTNANAAEIIKKQYFYKLRAHYGIFTSLFITQLVALTFSFMASGSMGSGGEGVSINVSYYTGNLIIAFTMLWAFISGVSMNSKLVSDGDFSFVTNRLTSHASSLAFLLTTTVVGGIMAMLGSSLLKTIIYFLKGDSILNHTYSIPVIELLIGVIATILYVTLFGIFGYAVASLTQLNKIFIFLLPLIFIGLLFVEGRTNGQGPLSVVFRFFAMESSLFLFAIKVIVVIGILCLTVITMSNKLEVRR